MNPNSLHGLYAITDSSSIPENKFNNSVKLALQGGARLIQYRDKSHDTHKRLAQASELRVLCNQYDALLIINDDINLAIQSNADGVHLGSEDDSLTDVRKKTGEHFIIGLSCYTDINTALMAEIKGADYVAFGAIYPSPTKPDAQRISLETLRKARSLINIPICAIGGINEQNAGTVIDTGIDMIAVISGLFSHENVREQSEALSSLFR